MRILLVTNFPSHHQLPFARALVHRLGLNAVRLATTESIPEERVALGWSPEATERWILRTADSHADATELRSWWSETDLVITGHRDLEDMEARLAAGKPVVYTSERWWKPPFGRARLLHPHFAAMALKFRSLARSPHFHYWPIGVHAARDLTWLAPLHERCWDWGYFTSLDGLVQDPKPSERGPSVLWVGRMLKLKRVETLIRAFAQAVVQVPNATLTLLGDGPERETLVALCSRILPPGSYRFRQPCPAADISQIMAQHRIFAFPSNAYEGWGAVVNEAMSAGCAVICSSAAGASMMIRHGENGLLFAPGDVSALSEHLVHLLGNDPYCEQLSLRGVQTISSVWNPELAADRTLAFAESLSKGLPPPQYAGGPLHRALSGS